MRRIAFFLVVLLLAAMPALADEIALSYQFSAPRLIEHADGTVEPQIVGVHQHVIPGYPIVPVHTAFIAIPQGHEVVDVRVEAAKAVTLTRALAAWGPKFAPFSEPTEAVAEANPAIYNGKRLYPAANFQALDTQYKRGVAIVPVALYPVQYDPAAQALSFAPALTVRVLTRPATKHDPEILPYRGLIADRIELAKRVDNPDLLASYTPAVAPKGDPVDYLIVSPAQYQDKLQDLLDHKTEMFGLRCEMVTYPDVLDGVAGDTIPERLRNYLRERYADGLQYVLLVGDADLNDEVLKLRPLYVTGIDPDDGSQYTEEQMATDQYYGCLDGNYNMDGDSLWGEPTDGPEGGDVDLLFDLHVGRFAVDWPYEAQIMAGKTMAFENDTDTPWSLLFVGEYADSITWGGDNKDEVFTHCNQDIPLTTLYDRDGTNTYSAIVNAINSNQHQWLNHLGHSNCTYNMSFDPGDVSDLNNTTYYLGFSQGCYSGSVDSVDVYGTSSVDCMAEQFTNKHVGGAFAYFQNTRYGFYLTGRVDGPSNVHDWELAEAFFSDGIPHIGWAMDKGKEDTIGMLSPNTMMRWSFYEIFLFGDPHTPMRLECDNDQDGFTWTYCGGDDCHDLLDTVNPDATEVCEDGLDNDCNGMTDEEDPVCATPDDDTVDDDTTDDDTVDDDVSDDDVTDDDLTDDDISDDDDSVINDDDSTDDDDSVADDDDDDDDDDDGCGN
ncbi:MAG TPA: C25 family cysteine peptidase [bacterium]|nr:C25 family cysteine peptidase [bacterium]